MKNKQKECKIWQGLSAHQGEIAQQSMRNWFAEDSQRFDKFHLQTGEILLDYSRNLILDQTMPLLCELAETSQLRQKIEALFTGEIINHTEKRPALHTALRDPRAHDFLIRCRRHQDLVIPLIGIDLSHRRNNLRP